LQYIFHCSDALGVQLQSDAAGPTAAGTGHKAGTSAQSLKASIWEEVIEIRGWAAACMGLETDT